MRGCALLLFLLSTEPQKFGIRCVPCGQRVTNLRVEVLGLQDDLENRRDAAAAKLESIRALPFKTPLKVREGTRREYAAFVLENARRVYGTDLAAAEKGLKAIGLIPPRLRLELALTAQSGFAPKAFCWNGELLLLDPKATEDWFVNKMDLGLVDQHYSPKAPPTYDAQMALAALRMGDAEVAKHLLWHSGKLPEDHAKKLAEETAAWERGDSKLASAVVPRLFVRSADFTWRRGGVFAHALHALGGPAALDKAWASPPATTEHVLHPEKYLAGEKAATIDPSAAGEFLKGRGYAEVYRTTLGELGAALVLETHYSREDLSAATEGWAGDVFAVYEKAGEPPLVLWATEWDTGRDALEFHAEALRVAAKLALPESTLLNPVVLKGSSVAVAVNVPPDLREAFLAAVWTCARTRERTDRYGD